MPDAGRSRASGSESRQEVALSWQAICLGCGTMSPEVHDRAEADRWATEHRSEGACASDVVIQLRCRMPGGGEGWFFG